MNTTLAIITAVVALIVSVFLWMRTLPPDTAAVAESSALIPAEDSIPAETHQAPRSAPDHGDEGASPATEQASGLTPTKADVERRDEEKEPAETSEIADEKIHQQVSELVQSALAGSRGSALDLSRILRLCLAGFDDTGQLQDLIHKNRMELPKSSRTAWVDGEPRTFEDIESYEAFMLAQFRQCQSVRGILNGGLREDILERAQDGSPTAW